MWWNVKLMWVVVVDGCEEGGVGVFGGEGWGVYISNGKNSKNN